jgi:hypothetical protein
MKSQDPALPPPTPPEVEQRARPYTNAAIEQILRLPTGHLHQLNVALAMELKRRAS